MEDIDGREFEICKKDGEVILVSYDGEREKIFVPYGITVIDDCAFKAKENDPYAEEDEFYENRGSENLGEVILPDTVKRIGREPFFGCEYLNRVYIPASVTDIGESVFSGCAPEYIDLDEDNPVYKAVDGCFIDVKNKTLMCGLAGCKIPADGSVKTIGKRAFNMRKIKSIEIPQGVVKIGNYAFTGCAELSEVKLPLTLREIGDCAFSQCAALKSIALPKGLKRIGVSAFAFSGLVDIELPAGLEYLGSNAFCNSALTKISLAPIKECGSGILGKCQRLERVEFLSGWKEIPVCTCTESRVREVVLPDGLEKIGTHAFSFCYSLKNIDFPRTLKIIEEQAFKSCGLVELTFPDSVKNVGWCAFSFCDGLTELTVPPLVLEKNSDVFYRCEKLQRVIIGEGTKRIAKNSFSCCYKLSSVTFPDSLEKIEYYAFGECKALKEVELSEKTEIADKAFYGCGVPQINELDLMDMPVEEYKKLISIKQGIIIKRR